MDIFEKSFSVIPGFFPDQRTRQSPYSSFRGLGADWVSIVGLVVQVAGYVIKWIGGNGNGKSSWSQFDDAQKEKFVADGLKEAYRMAAAGELGTSGRVVDAFAAIVQHVAPGPDWDTFYSQNSDWLPNRIAAAEKLYGHPFNSKPADWAPTTPTTPPGQTTNTTGILTLPGISQSSFGTFGIIGVIVLVGIGSFMLYDAVKRKQTSQLKS